MIHICIHIFSVEVDFFVLNSLFTIHNRNLCAWALSIEQSKINKKTNRKNMSVRNGNRRYVECGMFSVQSGMPYAIPIHSNPFQWIIEIIFYAFMLWYENIFETYYFHLCSSLVCVFRSISISYLIFNCLIATYQFSSHKNLMWTKNKKNTVYIIMQPNRNESHISIGAHNT